MNALTEGGQKVGLAIADISLREIVLLTAKRRITINKPLNVYLQFVESLFLVLPINSQIAERSTRFAASYSNDPADQLIGATAIVHGLRLVTKDQKIRASGEVDCIW